MLSSKNGECSAEHTEYYLSTVEIRDYNVLINSKNFFGQPVKNTKTSDWQWGRLYNRLLDYPYIKKLQDDYNRSKSKQQAFNANS